MIVVLLYISADSRLWRRDAQTEQITVFCDFSQKTSQMMIKCGFICERYTVMLFCWISQHYQVYSPTTEYQKASLTILPIEIYNLPFMGHKIPYLSSLLVTCHLSSRLYGVMPSTKFSWTIFLNWTKWQPELNGEILKFRYICKWSLTTDPDSIYFHRNVPHNTLFQNCTNHSALLNKMAARAKNRNILKYPPKLYWPKWARVLVSDPGPQDPLVLTP